MNSKYIFSFLGLVPAAVFIACVGMQNYSFIERDIASQKYGTVNSLAATDKFNLETNDPYLGKIQPIFNNRCISCHSCFNSPCQLNLTSFAGLDRGAIKDDIYDFRTVGEKTPTRLGIDVPQEFDWETTTKRWHQQKYVGSNGSNSFFPVINRTSTDPADRIASSVLTQMLTQKFFYEKEHDETATADKPFAAEKSRYCPINSNSDSNLNSKAPVSEELRTYQKEMDWAGMPYGFPQLSAQELSDIYSWVKAGSQPPKYELMRELSLASKPDTIKKWEDFFNGKDFRHRITARYIYEHLFLAHIYFDDMQGEFFRLIRSLCDSNGKNCHELPTRRPTDDPRSSEYYSANAKGEIFYKLQKVTSALVHKSHIPYQLNDQKLQKWEKIFIESISKTKKSFPEYGNLFGGNPFKTFREIPVQSRYQFLLDDSYFFVMSFIKGPVCRGNGALSVIDDHFWVFFLKPESDVTVQHPEFYTEAGVNLAVPAFDGNNWTLAQLFSQRRRYSRILKKEYIDKYNKNGFDLHDVWDGDGSNPNAVLTIYRHEDSASVSKGAIGEAPKTMWMLDYPIFEDIYYNLVGTYDVYAPIIHSAKSRLHMDASRFNAQDMYLSFLPKTIRKKIRKQWTMDKNAQLTTAAPNCAILPPELCAFYSQSAGTMRDLVYPYAGLSRDSNIALVSESNPQEELAEKIINSLPYKVTQYTSETINKKKTDRDRGNIYSYLAGSKITMSQVEAVMGTIAGKAGYFASFLPELSYVQVVDEVSGKVQWYTMIHNKERYNVAFFDQIAPESNRLWPEKDSINFVRGFVGSYANSIFSVSLSRFPEFIKDISELRDQKNTLTAFYKKFLVSRHNPNFWKYFDNLSYYVKQEGITAQSDRFEGSVLDLNRYINDVGF